MMQTIKGKVNKIKVLKLTPSPLVRFSVDGVSCLISKQSLDFMYKVYDDMDITVAGVFNDRNQFVVSRFCVMAKSYA